MSDLKKVFDAVGWKIFLKKSLAWWNVGSS